MSSIPTVDISSFVDGTPEQRHQVVAQVGAALEDSGCLTIVGHGVAPAIVARADAAYRAFFAKSQEDKRASAAPDPGWMRGFYGASAVAASSGPAEARAPDLREMFLHNRCTPLPDAYVERLGPVGPYLARANLWPAGADELRAASEAYYAAMERLASTLMQIFALALGLPQDHFADKIDCHHSTLSAAHYPEQREPPLPGQLRCGVHTDYGSMTILHQDDAPGGLQVQRPDGTWSDVTPVPGGLVVNLGDTMLEWTDGRWKSPPHRVVNPPPELAGTTRRQTLLFFHCPNYDTVLAPIPSCARPDTATDGPRPTVGELIFRKSMQATKTAAS